MCSSLCMTTSRPRPTPSPPRRPCRPPHPSHPALHLAEALGPDRQRPAPHLHHTHDHDSPGSIRGTGREIWGQTLPSHPHTMENHMGTVHPPLPGPRPGEPPRTVPHQHHQVPQHPIPTRSLPDQTDHPEDPSTQPPQSLDPKDTNQTRQTTRRKPTLNTLTTTSANQIPTTENP